MVHRYSVYLTTLLSFMSYIGSNSFKKNVNGNYKIYMEAAVSI